MGPLLAVALLATGTAPAIVVEPNSSSVDGLPSATAVGPTAGPAAVPAASNDHPTRTSEWYGGAAVGADVAATVLLFTAGEARSTNMGLASLALYTLAAPINHAVHGNAARVPASLALRAGSLVTTYLVLYQVMSHCGEESHASYCSWAPLAALTLPIAAMILDDALFARAPREDAGAPPAPARPSIAPGFAVAAGTAMVSLGGRF